MSDPHPAPLSDGQDALSLMLDDIRLSGAELLDLGLSPGTVATYLRPTRASVHIVLEGRVWLQRGDAPPMALETSDLVVVTTGERQRLSCTPEFDGSRMFDIGAVLEQRGRGRSGDAAWSDAAEPAARVASGSFRYDATFASPLIAALPPSILFNGAGEDAPAWLVIGLAFLAQERAMPRPAHQAVVNRLVDILMIECLREQVDRLPPDTASWLGAIQDPHLALAIGAIHREPERNWTVPELATIAHLSRSAFATRFSARLGQSPIAYLTSYRLRIAARQLRQSSLPVKAIAMSLGYESTVGFNQAFRREFGMPPSAMRAGGEFRG